MNLLSIYCGNRHSSWYTIFRPNPSAKLRLICFPPAGAGATFYSRWGGTWGQVEVCAIHPPGRGHRVCERLITRMEEMVKHLLQAVPVDKPFAFFGHSLGAMVAYETACKMMEGGKTLPFLLMVSACQAPQVEPRKRQRHLLPDSHLMSYLRLLGGTSEEVLAIKELLDLVLPIVRADFEVADSWTFQQRKPLPIPIVALGGSADTEIREEDLTAWRIHTDASFRLKIFPGNHFYVNTQRAKLEREMLDALNKT